MKKYIRYAIGTLLIVALTFSLFTCATTGGKKGKELDAKISKAFGKDDFIECAKLIGEKDKKGTDIALNLDIGLLQHIAGDYEASIKTLNKSATLIDEAFTKSISKEVAGAMFNPNLKDYAGNIYEYLFVNAFNALNYYNAGNTDEALVELRRLVTKQREYATKYGEDLIQDLSVSGDDLDSTNKSLSDIDIDMNDIIGHAPRKPTKDDVYNDSAFIRYLSLLLYTIDNDANNEEDGRRLELLNTDFAGETEAVTSIEEKGREGLGRLNLIAFAGKIVEREEGYFNLPVPLTIFTPNLGLCTAAFYIAKGTPIPPCFGLHFTYPKVQEQESDLRVSSVTITNAVSSETGENTSINLDLRILEDFDKAVKMEVATKAYKAFNASIFRSTTKKVLTLAAAETTMIEVKKNVSEPAFVDIVTFAAMPGIQKGLEALDKSEAPDIRGCKYFPRLCYAGGVDLPEGMYNVSVKYSNGAEKLIENVYVKKGKNKIVEALCLK